MLEPGEIKNLLIAFFAAAMIIGSATLYAVCVGLAGRTASRALGRAAAAAFVMLCGFVALFFYAANLRGFWLLLAGLMLCGYWFMPRAILRLTVATHGGESAAR